MGSKHIILYPFKNKPCLFISLLSLSLLFCLVFPSLVKGNGWSVYDTPLYELQGLGITGDYSLNEYKKSDGGLSLNYRFGFYKMIGLYGNLELGWRFLDRTINLRFGGDFFLDFLGLQAGILFSTDPFEDDLKKMFAPGMFLGIGGGMPYHFEYFAFFIFLGGNFYFINEPLEFYVAVSFLVNLSDNYKSDPHRERIEQFIESVSSENEEETQ